MDVGDLEDFCDKIDQLTDPAQISRFTIQREPKVELDVVVDGLIKQGVPTEDHQAQVTRHANKAPLKAKEKPTIPRNTPVFSDPPNGNRHDKLKHNNIVRATTDNRKKSLPKKTVGDDLKVCNFNRKGVPCPFGASCKFKHST